MPEWYAYSVVFSLHSSESVRTINNTLGLVYFYNSGKLRSELTLFLNVHQGAIWKSMEDIIFR